MGTPALAAHILKRLLDTQDSPGQVVAVVTRPDQPRGRGLKLQPSEVAAVAAAYDLPVLKPTKIRTAEFVDSLTSFQARFAGGRRLRAHPSRRRCWRRPR